MATAITKILLFHSFESAEQLKAHKIETHAGKTLTCPKCSKVKIPNQANSVMLSES